MIQIGKVFEIEIIFFLPETKIPGMIETSLVVGPKIIASLVVKYAGNPQRLTVFTAIGAFGFP